jgi:DUF1680 family protein
VKRIFIGRLSRVATIGTLLAAWAAAANLPVSAVPVKNVKIQDEFWTPRVDKNRTVTLPMLLDHVAAQGPVEGRLIESAAYILSIQQDPALRARIERMFDRTIAQLRRQKGVWANRGDGPGFSAGHFFEGAVAYYDATGDRKLLDAAIDIADDLANTFGPGRRYDIFNHEEIEIGLMKLYRATNNPKYLNLARFFVDVRGTTQGGRQMYGSYSQDHMPVREQSRAIGHAVRATYLYIALADLAALTGDSGYAAASDRIWTDAVSKRTFVTGGIGSYRAEEDFGDDYDLPNAAAWNEICAAVGNILWNQRMFLLDQDARYVDEMERILYNGFLVGVSQTGDRFLYQAPLMGFAGFQRQPRFGPNCCPPNLARLLAELGGLIYAAGTDRAYVNLFIGGSASLEVGGASVTLSQHTEYPWDGATRLTVEPARQTRFSLMLRIPDWASGPSISGGLYRFVDAAKTDFTLTVNGRAVQPAIEKGYARVDRTWSKGDVVELRFGMPVHRVVADARVADDRDRVAFQRGPIVFCAERLDNRDGVFNLVVPDDTRFAFEYRKDLLGGVGTLKGDARETNSVRAVTLTPYYAFGNRTASEMAVWLARTPARAVRPPAPTIASTSRATSSVANGTVADNYPGHNPPTVERRMYPLSQDGSGGIAAIYDQVQPVNSEDGSGRFLRIHPQSGDQAWVQYDFAKPSRISSSSVYWKDDKQLCILPKGWQLLYKDGDQWKPVAHASAYGVAPDQFNKVTFDPVTATGLRLEIQLQPKVYKTGKLGPPDGNYMDHDLTWYEGGVIEWTVDR